MVRRLIGLPLLLAVAACASANTASTRVNLTPKNGPGAHVYASYFGGITRRTVRTSFFTDKPAHVIVGRLGGDGRIEILYPENPKSSGLVAGRKTYDGGSFATSYDGLPQMYNYASNIQRSYAARADSYDGRGNGYVFIIATEFPMFTEVLDDHGEWSDSLEVADYYSSYDPRVSIRDFAEELTRGMPYSLDYADSFNTLSYSSYADYQYDCTVAGFISLGQETRASAFRYGGWMPQYGWWFGSGFDSFAWYFTRPTAFYTNGYTSLNACGLRYGRGFDAAYGQEWYRWGWAMGNNQVPSVGQKAPVPAPEKAPGFAAALRRPGFRLGDDGVARGSAVNVMRPRPTGQSSKTSTSTSTWAPPIRGTSASDEHINRRSYGNTRSTSSSSGSSGSSGSSSSSGSGSTRTAVARPAPAPAQASTPAPAQPAPSPKVAASSAGKPRDP